MDAWVDEFMRDYAEQRVVDRRVSNGQAESYGAPKIFSECSTSTRKAPMKAWSFFLPYRGERLQPRV